MTPRAVAVFWSRGDARHLSTATAMYSTCLFCQRDLGRNAMLEAFPVGRRLAFDAATGRLWVVCRRCGRWNLTPLEERWEAIEQGERLYRSTRLRAATDQIGLARLRDGTELVRIGRPERHEMAAWRYGDQLGRRRRQYLLGYVASVAIGVGSHWIGPLVAAAGVPGPLLLAGAVALCARSQRRRVGVATIPERTKPLIFRRIDAGSAALVAYRDGDWGLRVRASMERDTARWWQPEHRRVDCLLHGNAAIGAAAALLPTVNAKSGSRGDIQHAVLLLECGGSPSGVFRSAAHRLRQRCGARDPQSLTALPRPVQLALEMASHEEHERRAMEGELAELERAWRVAEEIARIADDLLIPASVRQALARARGAA